MSHAILSPETTDSVATDFWTVERSAMLRTDMDRGWELLSQRTWVTDSSHPKSGRWVAAKPR
jgi:hypothetical protein